MIVGITGTNGAGKGTVVEILKNKGFKHYSARDFITKEIKRRKLPVNRESMIAVANDLREKHGSSYVAEELYKVAKLNSKHAVIESIRTLGEIESLRNKGNFMLIAVDANPHIRFERVFNRGSATDNVSFEEFISQEQREMVNSDVSKQNLGACIELADELIINDGNLADLNFQVDKILEKLGIK